MHANTERSWHRQNPSRKHSGELQAKSLPQRTRNETGDALLDAKTGAEQKPNLKPWVANQSNARPGERNFERRSSGGKENRAPGA
jgi:hypothetical protein